VPSQDWCEGDTIFQDLRRPLDEHGGVLTDLGAGGQRLEAAFLHGGQEGETEIAQGLARRKPREPQRGLDAPQLALGALHRQHPVEEAVDGQVLFDRFLQ